MPLVKPFHLLPESASTVSGRVDSLVLFLLAVSAFFIVLICALIVAFAIKYHRRSEDEVPEATRTHTWLEVTWSVLPLFILMVMFFWGAKLYITVKQPPENALEINVIGKQWMWKIQHPDGQREINELHVPTGRPVKLVMISQDVIHSFFLPAFRIKQDVLPGSYVTQWFQATKPGEYHLFCAEYCGTSHSGMIGRVVVMTPEKYEAWLAGTVPDESPISAGARLFSTYGCMQCHGQTAPTLAGLYGRQVELEDGSTVTADEAYLRESILNPAAKIVAGYPRLMPSYRGQLSEEQVLQLVSYIKTLGATRSDLPPNQRTDVAGPASRPVTGFSPDLVPNVPPARQPPEVINTPEGNR